MISLMCTPSNTLSYRLQRVTQWMSQLTAVIGRRLNSSHVHCAGSATNPHTRKSHVLGSKRGIYDACSTGHFSVKTWPGGSLRFCSGVSSGFFGLKNDIKTPAYCRGAVTAPLQSQLTRN